LVRINVAKALGEIGDARAVETLIGVLSDDYQVLCRFASEALGKIGKPAVEPLIKALEGDNVYVRIYAAATLGEIGDKRAVEPLIKALGDDDCWVRENAVWALDGWKWKPEMDEHRVVYLLAKHDWDALVKWGERAVEPLIKAHRDGYWKAVCALGNIGDTRAVELLIKALGDDVQLVRSHAARALGRICDVREDTFSNVEPLIKVLSDNPSALDPYGGSDVRDAAKEALEKLGHEVE
jgi:HEAT repeat protein